MQWFKNLKVSVKLITAFIILALVSVFVGWFGISRMGEIARADHKLYDKMLVPVGSLVEIATLFHRARANVRDVLMSTSAEDKVV